MATVIRVSCPSDGCGDQRIQSTDVTLWMEEDADSGKYSFLCPRCHLRVSKEASVHIVTLLIGANVKVIRWTIPLELYDASRSSDREVVSLDDVLELHFALEEDDFIDRLAWGEQ